VRADRPVILAGASPTRANDGTATAVSDFVRGRSPTAGLRVPALTPATERGSPYRDCLTLWLGNEAKSSMRKRCALGWVEAVDRCGRPVVGAV